MYTKTRALNGGCLPAIWLEYHSYKTIRQLAEMSVEAAQNLLALRYENERQMVDKSVSA